MTSFDYKYQNALRQAIVFVVFFLCEESLVRDTNLHYRDCSETHSDSCSQMAYKVEIAMEFKPFVTTKCRSCHLSSFLMRMPSPRDKPSWAVSKVLICGNHRKIKRN